MSQASRRTKTKLHHHNFSRHFPGQIIIQITSLGNFPGLTYQPVPARHHQRTSPPPISPGALSRKTKPGQNQTLVPLQCYNTLTILWAHSCSVTADSSIEGAVLTPWHKLSYLALLFSLKFEYNYLKANFKMPAEMLFLVRIEFFTSCRFQVRTASLQLWKDTFETLNCILTLVALTSQERFQVAIVRDLKQYWHKNFLRIYFQISYGNLGNPVTCIDGSRAVVV